MECPRCKGSGQVVDDRVVGAAYRVRRLAQNVTLRDMAGRCDWSPAYLSDLELGKRTWNTKQMRRVETQLRQVEQ